MNGLMEGSWWFKDVLGASFSQSVQSPHVPAQVDGLGLPLRVVRHHAAERCHSLAIYFRGVRSLVGALVLLGWS